jgi:hypothetical protein
VWRGVSQAGGVAALQGGVTYQNSGITVDTWISSGAASNELDLTVSYTMQTEKFGWEAGVAKYYYTQISGLDATEIFAGINVNIINAYVYKNLDSSGSGDNLYLELSTDINGLGVALGVNSNDAATEKYNQITASYQIRQLKFAVSVSDKEDAAGVGARPEFEMRYEIPLQ